MSSAALSDGNRSFVGPQRAERCSGAPCCHRYLLTVDQAHQALAAADVVADVAEGQPVDHVAVVHHVSGEQKLVVSIVEADAATRVTGHVEHRQLPVPQVDDVAWTMRSRKQRSVRHVWLRVGL